MTQSRARYNREKLVALVPLSMLVVTLTGMINSFFWVFFLSALISVPHAMYHQVRHARRLILP